MTIPIGTLVLLPGRGVGRVFGNFGTSVGVELLPRKELVWIAESVVRPKEDEGEEVAYG